MIAFCLPDLPVLDHEISGEDPDLRTYLSTLFFWNIYFNLLLDMVYKVWDMVMVMEDQEDLLGVMLGQ